MAAGGRRLPLGPALVNATSAVRLLDGADIWRGGLPLKPAKKKCPGADPLSAGRALDRPLEGRTDRVEKKT